MGFKKEATLFKLVFEAYEGLEVYVKSLSVGELLDLTELTAEVSNLEDVKEVMAQSKSLMEVFAKNLVKWNLEDEDGTPVPATYEGIASQEFPFVLEIITTWMEQVAKVDENLEKKFSNTPSLDSLPMEVPQSPGN